MPGTADKLLLRGGGGEGQAEGVPAALLRGVGPYAVVGHRVPVHIEGLGAVEGADSAAECIIQIDVGSRLAVHDDVRPIIGIGGDVFGQVLQAVGVGVVECAHRVAARHAAQLHVEQVVALRESGIEVAHVRVRL